MHLDYTQLPPEHSVAYVFSEGHSNGLRYLLTARGLSVRFRGSGGSHKMCLRLLASDDLLWWIMVGRPEGL